MNVALQSCCCRDRAALVESFIARLAAGFGVGASPEAVQRANALLCELSGNGTLATIDGAAHFAIAIHPSTSPAASRTFSSGSRVEIACIRLCV
jgi:hypothetical protein